MKPVLITGAFGFVGSNLAPYLRARGFRLWALDTRIAAAQAGSHAYARVFAWDELPAIPLDETAAVIHLAGKAHDTRNTTDPQSYFTINTGLTESIVARLVAEPATRALPFILFSTVKAVADATPGILTEQVAPAPQTPYGQSKLAAERLVQASPLRAYILRPCMIHGPGNKGNLNLLYQVIRRGFPWPLGAFENRRSFAAIGNVCAVVERLLAGDVAPGVYQVADDEPLATNELIQLMAEALRRRARIWRLPRTLVARLAQVGDRLHLPLDSERLRKLTESYVVANDKLKRALGWRQMPVAARDGLRQTIANS